MRISDWSSDVCSSDLGAYVDNEAGFPINLFTNQKDVEGGNSDGLGMLRIWDTTKNTAGGWIYLPETAGLINYDNWNSLDMRLIPATNKIEYYFNGSLVYTWNDPTSANNTQPGQFYAMYLKARNHGVTTFDHTTTEESRGGTTCVCTCRS